MVVEGGTKKTLAYSCRGIAESTPYVFKLPLVLFPFKKIAHFDNVKKIIEG